MSEEKMIKKIYTGRATIEGASVRLHRAFGFIEVPIFDPFLMLDDFGSKDPEDYLAGFPWHPHRGMETVTYMIHGTVDHSDSLGNSGSISDGQVQWMSAGSGIIHQEMPQLQKDYLRGIQLWVNLPAKNKMMNPRYRDIKAEEIPTVHDENGVEVRVIAGIYKNTEGPVKDIICEPEYLDIKIPLEKSFKYFFKKDHTAFVYLLEGEGYFDSRKEKLAAGQLGLYGNGEEIEINSISDELRILCISGKPIREPIAWRGPVVMNDDAEITKAFEEYQNGTFIKNIRKN